MHTYGKRFFKYEKNNVLKYIIIIESELRG